MMNLAQIDIHTLLPQKTPFVFVDRLIQCNMEVTQTEFVVKPDTMFTQDGVLTEPGIIENIAQTCAVRMGYINCIVKANAVRVGFIGSIKNLIIYQLPKVGDLLETEIEIQTEVFNMTLVNANILVGSELIATCEMKISEQ
jgi:predicted hotdog family 3-hydroxylacyl-ACP dehydratase